VTLQPLVMSVAVDATGALPGGHVGNQADDSACVCCGGVIGVAVGSADAAVCLLCGLVRHLERPRIDEEARLVWLPEMSQAALNMVVRAAHCRLRTLGEKLDLDSTPSVATDDRVCLYHAQQALIARIEGAAGRLGSARPSDLADALLRLSPPAYRRRTHLLSGIRLLPAGRFFAGEDDIYPEVVDSWRGAALTDAVATSPSIGGSV
jgi:hypothetical protein